VVVVVVRQNQQDSMNQAIHLQMFVSCHVKDGLSTDVPPFPTLLTQLVLRPQR
jgi:hypothetical protein